ncbi:MAG: type II toxin-antitoxin system RelE/ParE family toxin [Pseudomonadota bacterium]|nr:type II toxin-antitoxin system RelE/ParE family toxin [Pseudomonadota bacterium]
MISKSGYRLTPDAQEELIEIRRYTLDQWGKAQSQKYLSELRQTIKLLSETPTIGKKCDELGAGIFSFPHASHVIYYMLYEGHIVVFGVLHKSMVPLIHLNDRSSI